MPIRLSMYVIDKGKYDIDFIGTRIKYINWFVSLFLYELRVPLK